MQLTTILLIEKTLSPEEFKEAYNRWKKIFDCVMKNNEYSY